MAARGDAVDVARREWLREADAAAAVRWGPNLMSVGDTNVWLSYFHVYKYLFGVLSLRLGY